MQHFKRVAAGDVGWVRGLVPLLRSCARWCTDNVPFEQRFPKFWQLSFAAENGGCSVPLDIAFTRCFPASPVHNHYAVGKLEKQCL